MATELHAHPNKCFYTKQHVSLFISMLFQAPKIIPSRNHRCL